MKPTKEQILNGTHTELAEWSAVHVMEWKKTYERGHEVGVCRWESRDGKIRIHCHEWSPATKDAQAFELVDELDPDDFNLSKEKRHVYYECEIILKKHTNGDVSGATRAEAITKAAILAKYHEPRTVR